jgi:hypothetical protein
MSELMDRAVIGMPYGMAMESEVSRRQFYARAQALLAERDAYKKDAERYRFLMRELGGSVAQVIMGSPTFSNEDVDAAIDATMEGGRDE